MTNHKITTFLQKIAPFVQKNERIIDCVCPIVPPKTKLQSQKQNTRDTERNESELKAIDNLLEHSIDATKKAHEDVLELLRQGKERVQVAENKLATLFVMSAISASLVLSVNGLASAGAHWAILVVTGYCLFQLIRLLFATLYGLKRRPFTALTITDMAPLWTNSEDIKHLVQIVRTATINIHEFQQAGHEKITALAIAHAAFRNYLCGLTFLFVVSIFLSPEKETLEIKTQKIIYEIERHPRILEVLRGTPKPEVNIDPSGLQGPPRTEGDMGSPGQRELPKPSKMEKS